MASSGLRTSLLQYSRYPLKSKKVSRKIGIKEIRNAPIIRFNDVPNIPTDCIDIILNFVIGRGNFTEINSMKKVCKRFFYFVSMKFNEIITDQKKAKSYNHDTRLLEEKAKFGLISLVHGVPHGTCVKIARFGSKSVGHFPLRNNQQILKYDAGLLKKKVTATKSTVTTTQSGFTQIQTPQYRKLVQNSANKHVELMEFRQVQSTKNPSQFILEVHSIITTEIMNRHLFKQFHWKRDAKIINLNESGKKNITGTQNKRTLICGTIIDNQTQIKKIYQACGRLTIVDKIGGVVKIYVRGQFKNESYSGGILSRIIYVDNTGYLRCVFNKKEKCVLIQRYVREYCCDIDTVIWF